MSVNAPFGDVICPFNLNFSRFFSTSFTFWIVVNCIFMLGTKFAPSKIYHDFSFNVYCFIPNNIISFICLKSLQWNHLPFVDSIFLCSLFTRHFNSQYLKIIVSIFFSVFDLMNCCKFQKPMTKPILKESVAKLWNKNV